jgi:hypothetical protein
MADVREFLAQVGFQASAVVEGEDTNYFILPSGARITFDDQKIHSIIFTKRTATQPTKQISVSIPKETWKQLKTLARQSNQSVSELCSDWITQRTNGLQHDAIGRE